MWPLSQHQQWAAEVVRVCVRLAPVGSVSTLSLLMCQPLWKPADTRHVDTHASTHTLKLSSPASAPRPQAPRGLSVSDAGDSGESERGAGAGSGFLTCEAGPRVRSYRSSEGSQAPFSFLSLAVKAIHHRGHDWRAQTAVSVRKWAVPYHTDLASLIRRDEALTQWLVA